MRSVLPDSGAMTPVAPEPPTGERPELLDWMFARQSRLANASQRDSIRQWQAKGRYYERVQQAVAGEREASSEVLLVLSDLQDLAQSLGADVRVWRGIRSVRETFGAGIDDLMDLPDQNVRRFMSTSVHHGVVRDEFLYPGSDVAIVKVQAKAGAAAVWVPPIGSAEMRYQGELLFQPGVVLRIVAVDASWDVPIIEAEVSRS